MSPESRDSSLELRELPAPLRHNALRVPGGSAWLRDLEASITSQCARWHVRPIVESGQSWFAGHAGVVIPVVEADGNPRALKFQIPDPELTTEAAALRVLAGHGAVTLHNDEGSFLLLEWLDPRRNLGHMPTAAAEEIWGTVMRRLGRRISELPSPGNDSAPFERTDAVAERWNDELPARWADRPEVVPRRLLEAALEVCQTRGAVGRHDNEDFLVHADLHHFNVLARPTSDDYVAIDPQLYVGDREFGVLPMLHNRLGDLPVRNSAAALRTRCRQLSLGAGLDVDLAMAWSIARAVEDIMTFTEEGLPEDAERSLWVATALSHGDVSQMPGARQLKPLV